MRHPDFEAAGEWMPRAAALIALCLLSAADLEPRRAEAGLDPYADYLAELTALCAEELPE